MYIVQKLVEQFLRRIDASLKRDLYYWHAYYVSSILSSSLFWFFDKEKVTEVTLYRIRDCQKEQVLC